MLFFLIYSIESTVQYILDKTSFFFIHTHTLNENCFFFSSSDINKSLSCTRLIKKLCHRPSVSCSIIIVLYMSTLSLSSLYARARILSLSGKRIWHTYILREKHFSLCKWTHLIEKREREEKSQEGIRERELIIGRKRELILCCCCCIRMSLLPKIKVN